MIADIELTTLETGPCAACGRRHRHRLALFAAGDRQLDSLLGFFAACPNTGRRVWHVGPVPRDGSGGSLLFGMGPADDEGWVPASAPDVSPPWIPPRAATVSPLRGRSAGGPRGRSRTPELVRRVLGCPIT